MKRLLLILLSFIISGCLLSVDYPTSTTYANGADSKIAIYQSAISLDADTFDNVGINLSTDPDDFHGFAWLKGGFNVINGTGNVDFATPFVIGNGLNLNSNIAVLRLASDLIMGAGTGIEDVAGSSGFLNCNGYGIVLSGEFPTNGNYIEFVDSGGRIYGNGNLIDFYSGGYFKVGSDSTFLSIRSAYLRDVSSDSFQFDDNTKTLYLWNSVVDLSENIVFDHNVGIVGDLLITGTHTVCFNRNLDLYDDSRVIIDVGITFSFGSSASVNLVGSKRKGTIHFNGCDILIGDNDFSIDGGRIIFENQVTIYDSDNYKDFICGANTLVDVVGSGRVVLESTTTFSVL